MAMTLTNSQKRFVHTGSPRFALSGPRGTGKTWAAAYRTCLHAIARPQTRYLFWCLLTKDAQQPKQTIHTLLDTFGMVFRNLDTRAYELLNGSKIDFCGGQGFADKRMTQGRDYHGIMVDNADTFPEYRRQEIEAAVARHKGWIGFTYQADDQKIEERRVHSFYPDGLSWHEMLHASDLRFQLPETWETDLIAASLEK